MNGKLYKQTLLIAVVFVACNASPNKTPDAGSNSSGNADTEIRTPADQTPKVFKGLFNLSDNLPELVDCNGQNRYWVADSTDLLLSEYQEQRKTLPYEGETMYAELKGYLSGRADSGDASSYENVLVVTGIIKTEPKNFKTECYGYEFIAIGNEPFWSVDIIPAEQRIVLKDIAQNKLLIFPYQPANIGGGVYRFDAVNPDKQRIAIIIREEKCSDDMSNTTYNYSAEINVDGRILKGYAIKKGDTFTDQP